MKKAALTFESLMWIPRIIFLVIVIFSIMYLIRSFITTTIDTSELQANLFAYRILYSLNSISYADTDIERLYPGVIDLGKFNQQNTDRFLERTIYYGDKNNEIGAKLLLKDLQDNQEFTTYYNEDFFKEQKKLVDSGYTEGPGGARGYAKNYNVVIREDDSLHQGKLTIDVVIPNS